MPTEQSTHLDVEPGLIGTLELDRIAVPYVDLEDRPSVHTRLRVGETEYVYERSYPVQGHSAIMPGDVAELLEAGRQVLVAERGERYLLYLA